MNTETRETVGTIAMLFVGTIGTINETRRIPNAGPKHYLKVRRSVSQRSINLNEHTRETVGTMVVLFVETKTRRMKV